MARKKPVVITAPKRIEARYYAELNKYIRAVDAWVRENVMPWLENWAKLDRMELRGDSSTARFDAAKKQVDMVFERLESLTQDMFGTTWAETIAVEQANAVNVFNDDKNIRAIKRVIGIDLIQAEPWLKPRIETFVSSNVDLISSLKSEHLRKVKLQVMQAVENGARNEVFAREIESRFGRELAKVTNNVQARAKLIARDQISKFNGKLTETRQEAAGFKKYQWVTAGDERVRETHRALNGKIIAWNDPPSVGHPGEDYQCRCYAAPVLSPDMESDVSLRRLFNR